MKEKDRRHSHWYISTRWTLAQDKMAESRQSTTTTTTTPDTTSTITTSGTTTTPDTTTDLDTTTTLCDDGKSETPLSRKVLMGTAAVMGGIGTAAAVCMGTAAEIALKK